MKILYDHSVFQFQRYGGISRYFYELITRLSDRNDVNINLFQGIHVNEYDLSNHKKKFESYWGYKWKYNLPATKYMSHIFAIPNRILFNSFCAKFDNFEIYHPTYYMKGFKKNTKAPIVLTVHDMIHELFPDQFSDSKSVIEAKKISIESADVIICISENTKKDLIEHYDVAEKIRVVYHGNSLKSLKFYETDLKAKYELLNKFFILYVGERSGYKNFNILFETYLSYFSDIFDLVCFGGEKFSNEELKAINSLKSNKKVIHLNGSDDLLASLYKNAFCFVYPSRYEGFGIPLLEAMSMGCPIIASKASSIPEVVGDAAILFDPYSKESLYDAIELLMNNDSQRELLIKRGFQREKDFSWDKTVDETLKIYKSII